MSAIADRARRWLVCRLLAALEHSIERFERSELHHGPVLREARGGLEQVAHGREDGVLDGVLLRVGQEKGVDIAVGLFVLGPRLGLRGAGADGVKVADLLGDAAKTSLFLLPVDLAMAAARTGARKGESKVKQGHIYTQKNRMPCLSVCLPCSRGSVEGAVSTAHPARSSPAPMADGSASPRE